MTPEELEKATWRAIALEETASLWGGIADHCEHHGLSGADIARERERELLAMARDVRRRIKVSQGLGALVPGST